MNDDDLALVKNAMERYLEDFPIINNFKEHFSFGKMLRSKLILAIAPRTDESVNFCAIIELVHFASLLHDDVIDNANLRRGKSSINAVYGNKNAIMLGDLIYAKAFYEASKLNQDLAQIVSNAVVKLSLGELEDVFLSKTMNLDSKKYLSMINHKTAALIEASAVGAGKIIFESSEKYKIYGNALGIAYQIIDDLLDIVGTDEKLGKNSFSDFKEGKTTLPYIYLYESLDSREREVLGGFFKKELNADEKEWIAEKMRNYKILEKTRNLAHKYAQTALNALDSKDILLKEIVEKMLQREC